MSPGSVSEPKSFEDVNVPPPPREVAIRTLASDMQALRVSGGSRAQFSQVSLPTRTTEPVRVPQIPAIPVVGKRTYEVPRTRIIWVILGFLSLAVLIFSFYFGYRYISAWFVALKNPPPGVATSTTRSIPSPIGVPIFSPMAPSSGTSGVNATGTGPVSPGDGPPTLHL